MSKPRAAQVAALIHATPREIIFTSGATEANNLALLGAARAARRSSGAGHIVTSRIEHKSVLDTCRQLEKEGFALTLIEPDATGRILPEAVRAALRADTLLLSLMLANNEIGVLTDIAACAALCRARGVLVHIDASQAVGKVPVDVAALDIDFLSLTAHKFYGPKGIGALYVRESARPKIAAIQFGGGHERGLRSGTLPTHQIEGFGAAAAIARVQGAADAAHARDLAARLWRELEPIPGAAFNGHHEHRVPGLINVSFAGVEGESLITGLSGTRGLLRFGLQLRDTRTELRPAFARPRRPSSRKVRCGCLSAASRPPPTSMKPPPPSAPRSGACTPWPAGVIDDHLPAGSGESPNAPAGSLLARALTPLTRRYFLAPARVPEFPQGQFRRRCPPRPGRAALGRHAGFLRVAHCRRDCEKRPFQRLRMPPYSGGDGLAS